MKDFIAIGVGPFNLGLACLSEPIEGLDGIFLDKKELFDWHPGMLLQDATLQVPFLADLVTLADPTSPYSFLNYLKEQGRIYSFYIKENFFALRSEYNEYCKWACKKSSNIQFNKEVESINYDSENGIYKVISRCTLTNALESFSAKKLVLGVGSEPCMPTIFKEAEGLVLHSSQYLGHRDQLHKKKIVTVVGSGQSAAEIYYDLLQSIDEHGYELKWITRSPRFYPLEYSKLTLEMTSPDYADYFYDLPDDYKRSLLAQQRHLYKGINFELINNIYDLLYAKSVHKRIKTMLLTNSECRGLTSLPNGELRLDIYQKEQNKKSTIVTEGLIVALGYEYNTPKFLNPISERIRWTEAGAYKVAKNYSIDIKSNEVFVQNAEIHTHGFVAPDLGMGCYRNSKIIKEITGKEHYPIENNIAFQQFGVI